MYDERDDYQNDWNNYAANQNAAVDQQRLASLPDPRQLAAQALVQRYAPKPPSYSNVLGHYQVNGQDAADQTEAGAMHQFQHAKQQAAQSYLDRQSGNYAAGTAGRSMLRDPSFMGLPDDQSRNQVYQQAYGNSLGEDLQADSSGAPMTIHDLRYHNAAPERMKQSNLYLKGFESNTGINSGDLLSPLQRDQKGMPVSGYDDREQMHYTPGGWVQEVDKDLGTPTGRFIQKPAKKTFIPREMRQRVMREYNNSLGMDERYQPPPMPAGDAPLDPQADEFMPEWLGHNIDRPRPATQGGPPPLNQMAAQAAQQRAAQGAPQVQSAQGPQDAFGFDSMPPPQSGLGNMGRGMPVMPSAPPLPPQQSRPGGAGIMGHTMQQYETVPQFQDRSGGRSFGMTPSIPDPMQDAAQTAKIQRAFQQSNETLHRNGIALPPTKLKDAMRLATSFAGGQEYTEQMLVQAARILQDEVNAREETTSMARDNYQNPPPTGDWSGQNSGYGP